MFARTSLFLLFIVLLILLPSTAFPQLDPGVRPASVIEILDPAGTRLGIIVVAGRSGRGFEAGHEYWSVGETTMRTVSGLESLELNTVAVGEWDDPWIVEALRWRPADTVIAWRHPAIVEWTKHADMRPPTIRDGTYFDNPTIGGLSIQYDRGGRASLTWFKFTEGAFMQLHEGARFIRSDRTPSSGFWWHGLIERRN